MGFQFVSEQCYSRVRGQQSAVASGGRAQKTQPQRCARTRFSAREILQEALRLEGHCPHVASPQPPREHYGLPAQLLMAWYDTLEQRAQQTRVQTAARGWIQQRADTPILLAAVASYPGPANDDEPLYVRWREHTVAFFRERYGKHLVSILEHVDEANGHLHALVAKEGASVKTLHSGHAAKLQALAAGHSAREQHRAYRSGTRAYQEEFYQKVGLPSGLLRFGPRRARKTRAEYLADQEQQRRLAQALLEKEKAEREKDAAEAARRAAERDLAAFEWDKLEFDRIRREQAEHARRDKEWVLLEADRLQQEGIRLREEKRTARQAESRAKALQQALGEAAAAIIDQADPALRKVIEARLLRFFPRLAQLRDKKPPSEPGLPRAELLLQLAEALEEDTGAQLVASAAEGGSQDDATPAAIRD